MRCVGTYSGVVVHFRGRTGGTRAAFADRCTERRRGRAKDGVASVEGREGEEREGRQRIIATHDEGRQVNLFYLAMGVNGINRHCFCAGESSD